MKAEPGDIVVVEWKDGERDAKSFGILFKEYDYFIKIAHNLRRWPGGLYEGDYTVIPRSYVKKIRVVGKKVVRL